MEDASAGSPRQRGGQITERDTLVLEFLSVHRLALAGHVAALLGVTTVTASRRLRTLMAAGLLNEGTRFHGYPASYGISRRGLALIGSRLPPPGRDSGEYAHDVGVAWLWLAARHGAFGPLSAVVSEREMRSHDGVEKHEARALGGGPSRPSFGVPLSALGRDGQTRLHYPDLLLLDRDGRRIAVELELSSKGQGRRHKIIGGYAADPRIDAVLYLVEDPRIARAVQATARRFGFERRVLVQPVRFGAGQVPGREAAAERRADRPPAYRSRNPQAAELARAAKAAGRGFRVWTPDGPSLWNPLAHGNATELKDKLISMERFSEIHYQRAAERYLQLTLQLLQLAGGAGRPPTLHDVVSLMDPARLEALLRLVPEAFADRVHGYLAELTPDQLSAIRGLGTRLAIIDERPPLPRALRRPARGASGRRCRALQPQLELVRQALGPAGSAGDPGPDRSGRRAHQGPQSPSLGAGRGR